MKKFVKMIAAVMAAATIAVTASVCASANIRMTADDSEFLNEIGVCYDYWGSTYTIFNWSKVSGEVDNAWAKVGVVCVTHVAGNNDYYIKGEQVSREAAMRYACHTTGKQVDIKKYVEENSKTPRCY